MGFFISTCYSSSVQIWSKLFVLVFYLFFLTKTCNFPNYFLSQCPRDNACAKQLADTQLPSLESKFNHIQKKSTALSHVTGFEKNGLNTYRGKKSAEVPQRKGRESSRRHTWAMNFQNHPQTITLRFTSTRSSLTVWWKSSCPATLDLHILHLSPSLLPALGWLLFLLSGRMPAISSAFTFQLPKQRSHPVSSYHSVSLSLHHSGFLFFFHSNLTQ